MRRYAYTRWVDRYCDPLTVRGVENLQRTRRPRDLRRESSEPHGHARAVRGDARTRQTQSLFRRGGRSLVRQRQEEAGVAAVVSVDGARQFPDRARRRSESRSDTRAGCCSRAATSASFRKARAPRRTNSGASSPASRSSRSNSACRSCRSICRGCARCGRRARCTRRRVLPESTCSRPSDSRPTRRWTMRPRRCAAILARASRRGTRRDRRERGRRVVRPRRLAPA